MLELHIYSPFTLLSQYFISSYQRIYRRVLREGKHVWNWYPSPPYLAFSLHNSTWSRSFPHLKALSTHKLQQTFCLKTRSTSIYSECKAVNYNNTECHCCLLDFIVHFVIMHSNTLSDHNEDCNHYTAIVLQILLSCQSGQAACRLLYAWTGFRMQDEGK